MEIWRDIKGYEGLYQVSNLGRVKSVERRVISNKSGGTRIVGGILSPWDNGHGHLVVSLSNGQKRKNHYVHRLAAEAFLYHPKNENYINHKDYNTRNNSVENLEWCTQKHNTEHSREHMRKPKSKCKASNTGEKYITRKTYHGRVRYRVQIKLLGCEKNFLTLDDAIRYKNEVMGNWQNQ